MSAMPSGGAHHSRRRPGPGPARPPWEEACSTSAGLARPPNDPYDILYARGVLTPGQVRGLEVSAPDTGAFLAEELAPGREKNYRMNLTYLMRRDETEDIAASMTPDWQTFYREAVGPEFRVWLERGTGLALSDSPLDVAVYRHGAGDFISVHRDKPEKRLTCIFYLNGGWPTGSGGCYEARGSSDPETPPRRTFEPVGGNVLAFSPTERSWHSVSAVLAGAPTRLTVQLEFWNE